MRYFVALNIKDTAAYSNVNARLLYLHMLCCMDYAARTYCASSRTIAAQLGISHKAARCAIDALIASGLIRAQERAQERAQTRAQATIYYINNLDDVKGTSEGTSEGTDKGTQISNYSNYSKSLSLARVISEFGAAERIEGVAEYMGCSTEQAAALIAEFTRYQELRQRDSWRDITDAWQHLLSWLEKRYKRQKLSVTAVTSSDPRSEPSEEGQPNLLLPDGYTRENWESLCHIVSTPNHAPVCDELYKKALANLEAKRLQQGGA